MLICNFTEFSSPLLFAPQNNIMVVGKASVLVLLHLLGRTQTYLKKVKELVSIRTRMVNPEDVSIKALICWCIYITFYSGMSFEGTFKNIESS